MSDPSPSEDAALARARAENEHLQRRVEVLRWRLRSLQTRRAWRLHAALHAACTSRRGLLLLPARLLGVLVGPPMVVPPVASTEQRA